MNLIRFLKRNIIFSIIFFCLVGIICITFLRNFLYQEENFTSKCINKKRNILNLYINKSPDFTVPDLIAPDSTSSDTCQEPYYNPLSNTDPGTATTTVTGPGPATVTGPGPATSPAITTVTGPGLATSPVTTTVTGPGPATSPATTTVTGPATTTVTGPGPATSPATTTVTGPGPATSPATTTVTGPATTTVTSPGPATSPATTTVTGPGPATSPATTTVTGPATSPATTTVTGPATGPATTTVTGPATSPATTTVTGPATSPATTTATGPATSSANGFITPNLNQKLGNLYVLDSDQEHVITSLPIITRTTYSISRRYGDRRDEPIWVDYMLNKFDPTINNNALITSSKTTDKEGSDEHWDKTNVWERYTYNISADNIVLKSTATSHFTYCVDMNGKMYILTNGGFFQKDRNKNERDPTPINIYYNDTKEEFYKPSQRFLAPDSEFDYNVHSVKEWVQYSKMATLNNQISNNNLNTWSRATMFIGNNGIIYVNKKTLGGDIYSYSQPDNIIWNPSVNFGIKSDKTQDMVSVFSRNPVKSGGEMIPVGPKISVNRQTESKWAKIAELVKNSSIKSVFLSSVQNRIKYFEESQVEMILHIYDIKTEIQGNAPVLYPADMFMGSNHVIYMLLYGAGSIYLLKMSSSDMYKFNITPLELMLPARGIILSGPGPSSSPRPSPSPGPSLESPIEVEHLSEKSFKIKWINPMTTPIIRQIVSVFQPNDIKPFRLWDSDNGSLTTTTFEVIALNLEINTQYRINVKIYSTTTYKSLETTAKTLTPIDDNSTGQEPCYYSNSCMDNFNNIYFFRENNKSPKTLLLCKLDTNTFKISILAGDSEQVNDPRLKSPINKLENMNVISLVINKQGVLVSEVGIFSFTPSLVPQPLNVFGAERPKIFVPPDAPFFINIGDENTNTSLKISWQDQSFIGEPPIYIVTNTQLLPFTQTITNTNSVVFSEGLEDGKEYTINVKAQNSLGERESSITIKYLREGNSIPSDLNLTLERMGDTIMKFSWNKQNNNSVKYIFTFRAQQWFPINNLGESGRLGKEKYPKINKDMKDNYIIIDAEDLNYPNGSILCYYSLHAYNRTGAKSTFGTYLIKNNKWEPSPQEGYVDRAT